MRYINKIFFLLLLGAIVVAGCRKIADLPYYNDGNAVALSANKTAVIATAADSMNNVITFSWTAPNYATDTSTVKYILEIDSSGRNFSKSTTRIITGQRSASLTGKDLNALMLNYGLAVGTAYNMDVRVISSYGNNNEQYKSNTLKIAVTPYNDPSVLTSSVTSVTPALATSSQPAATFSWTSSFSGYSGAVTYTLQYDSSGKNFASPHEIAVGTSLYSKVLTQGEINATALDEGVPGATTGKIEYRIKATTALGAIAYSNAVSVTIQTYIPLLRFYLPGGYQAATGNGNDWDPATAPELIRDLRPGLLNSMYYTYVYLPAGAQFKVTQGRDWAINYGGSGGVLALNGGNFSVTTAGVYRVSIDVNSLTYDIRPGRMGFVGGATGAGWNPPNVFPNYAMGAPADNLFVGITSFTADAWKLIDNDQWNNGSNSVTETRSYGSTGGAGSTMEINGANFPNITTAGTYRVIWDGRNPDNITYDISPATEMRVVGDGIQGVNAWDPASSPQMNYMGNGVWQVTLTLVANKDIKFLAGNAWGAFDYEDASGGSQATGTARKIQWSGGPNFKTPATTGSYTITLNEYTQTVTIN